MATPPNFTAGQILTAAQMNSVGLWLVKSQTIGTGVSSVTVSNAFNADYDAYKIVVSGGTASTLMNVGMTLGASTTGYYAWMAFGSSTVATVNGLNLNNGTSWTTALGASTNGFSGWVEIQNPFLALPTMMSSQFNNTTSFGSYNAWHSPSTSYSSFTFTASGTFTGGTISVYGYRK